MLVCRNTSFATVEGLAEVLNEGRVVTVRGEETRELLSWGIRLQRPSERYVLLPRRLNDVFQQFAETMWVLAGRDDIAWLEGYLPRASLYSDDGIVWRGAYGPRLRRWRGAVDQIGRVLELLREDPLSRRAVMVIFDPELDYVVSKDIPCNNWLSWMARDGRLHLNIGVRSNDALWGFSGINAFEWSVLQEMMAHWLGLEVGEATYLASSFHLYSSKYKRSTEIVERFKGITPYDHVEQTRFETSWDLFPSRLEKWFSTEEAIREDPDLLLLPEHLTGDKFLDSGLKLVRLKWGEKSGWPHDRMVQELRALPDADYVVAAYEYFSRQDAALLEDIPQQGIAAFFAECSVDHSDNFPRFKEAITRLHARKDKAYGGAWKRRGAKISILPNIARKVDRLEEYMKTKAGMVEESLLDTVIDLYVYTVKYRLFLAEDQEPGTFLAKEAATPFSDHYSNFDSVVRRLEPDAVPSFGACVDVVIPEFENLCKAVYDGEEGAEDKADEFLHQTESLLISAYRSRPAQVADFIRAEFANET